MKKLYILTNSRLFLGQVQQEGVIYWEGMTDLTVKKELQGSINKSTEYITILEK